MGGKMDSGLFSAATGMIVKGIVQDVIGRNLANISTTGYKRERVIEGDFATQLTQALAFDPSLRRKSGTYMHEVVTDFSPGPLTAQSIALKSKPSSDSQIGPPTTI